MSPDTTPFSAENTNNDEKDPYIGAWHVSTVKGTRRVSSGFTLSDPRLLQLLREQHTRDDTWSNFTSDETLQHPSHIAQNDLPDHGKPVPENAPPAAVGFWSSGLAKTRREVFLNYIKILFILCVFVFAVLSIYWGVLAQVYKRLDKVTVAVVNFDGLEPYQNTEPLIGPLVVSQVLAQLNVPQHLGYTALPPSDFNNDPMNVRVAVHDEKFWAAIVINKNATALLRRAVETGNSSYDPLGAAQIIYNQARDIEAYNQYVSPVLTALAADISARFGRNWTSSVLANQTLNINTYSRAPQALSPGIQFSIFNLRPFDPPTAIPTVSIGLIYLIIVAFFSFGFFIPTHLKFTLPNPQSPHPPLKFHQLILWRYTATLLAYFLLSLSYSLVSLAFQIPFSHPSTDPISSHDKTAVLSNATPLNHATFPAYWMLNFMGMAALGLACENMAMLLGAPWTALWLIFWVITNVATGFYSLELAPDFYAWGYAWPLRQIVVGSRALLFGTKDCLGVNFGILAAWIAVGTLLFPGACWVFRYKAMNCGGGWRRKKEEKKNIAPKA